MLVLTETAAEVVKSVTSAPQSSQTAGLRISSSGLRISSSVAEPGEASALQVEAVPAPDAGDQVLEAAGAHVFVAPQAAGFLDDKVLDAEVDEAGNVRFSLAEQQPGDVL